MKILLSITLGALFAVTVGTSAFAGCSHGYQSADMSELKIAAEDKKSEAMSTHNPAKVEILPDTKKPAQEVKTSE